MVSATMITIVFSLTVSLQIASSQFSVRAANLPARCAQPGGAGILLAPFGSTAHTVGEHRDGGAFIPKVAVTGSLRWYRQHRQSDLLPAPPHALDPDRHDQDSSGCARWGWLTSEAPRKTKLKTCCA